MGKARKFSSNDDDAVLQSQSDSENYAIGAQQNAQNLGSVHFSDNSGYGNFIQSGRDQRNASLEGALFRGNIGFNLQICKLDVGTQTINLLDDGTTPLSVISTDRIVTLSAGITADLTTILGSQRPGQRLLLYGIQGNTITIKHTASATDNTILTPDGNDFTFEGTASVLLAYDITTVKWRIVGGTSSGGGGGTINAIKNPCRCSTQFNYVDFSLVGNNIDGVIAVVGDRILVNNQVIQSENGIYAVTGESPPGVLQLTRATDFDEDSEVIAGVLVYVTEGTVDEDVLFSLITDDPITVGVTSLVFVPIGGGSGLTDPIILNENDLGTVGFLNQLIDWSTNNFYRMTLNGDISITMQNLPVAGKWEQVIVEFTQDAVGSHTVTFLDVMANGVTPTINPGAFSKTTVVFYAYNDGSNVILAFDVDSNFTEFPEFDHGTVGPAAIDIDWSISNFQRMVLAGDVLINHINLPSAGNWQQVVVEYTQDIPANHNVDYVQTFANGVVPLVNFGTTSKTTVVFYAYNTGAITIILAFETMSGGNTNFLHATEIANQAPPLTVGTPILFDSIISNSGLTVLAGIVSGFKAGRTYECECSSAILNAVNPAACVNIQFNDIANATLIGSRGDAILTGQLATQSAQPIAKAIFIPLANTDTLEVQFVFNNDLVNNFLYGMGIPGTPQTYLMIKDIS